MNLSTWKRIINTRYGVPLGLSILVQGMLMAVVIPIVPIFISQEIGLDKAGVTLFFLLNTTAAIVVMLGTGYLSDGTIARYKLVIAAGVIGALGYVGIAAASQHSHVYLAGVCTVAVGIVFAQLFAVAKTGIVASWEREAQVMGITALRTLFSFGFIFGTAISSRVAGLDDLQPVFFTVAGAILLAAIYAAVVLYRVEGHITRQAAQPVNVRNAVELPTVTLPVYALIVPLVALVVLRGADSTRGSYLSLAMFQLFEDASIAPVLFGITAAAELVTMGFVSYLASRIGEKTTIAVCALFGTLYFVMLSFTQSLLMIYAAHVVYAVFLAALLGVALAYEQGLLSDRAGMGGSLYMAVMNLGSFIGILSSLLVTGYDQTIFIAPAVLCLVGAVLLLVGDRTAEIEKRLREAPPAKPIIQEEVMPTLSP